MAIGYLNVAIIGRSSGRSAVAAAAYASRSDLVDERTGTAYRYARKSGDIVTSFLWLPKGAPEYLRDRATLWNQVEKAETKKNSQTARRIIMALPHELTEKQQQQLLQDFVRENFTRKGLAVDASIHAPDPDGDDRNHHAHLLIPTRFMNENGLGKKDRVSNDRATGMGAWKESWVKLANRQLERYGHAARITFEVAEGQTPQKHMGPQATALERQGVETRTGDDRLEIITDNMQPPANDNVQARSIGSEFEQVAGRGAEIMPTVVPGRQRRPANDNARQPVIKPEIIDRDRQEAEWQDAVDDAGIKADEAREVTERKRQHAERAARAEQWQVDRMTQKVERVEARLGFSSADMQTRHHAEMGAFHSKAQRERLALQNYLKEHYSAPAEELAREIAVLSRQKGRFPRLWAKLTGKEKTEAERLTQARESLGNLEQRKAEPQQALARQQRIAEEQLQSRHDAEVQSYETKPDYQDLTQWVKDYRAEIESMAARKEARQERERGGRDFDGPELKL